MDYCGWFLFIFALYGTMVAKSHQAPASESHSSEYDLIDPKRIPKRQYFDSLGGMALGKRNVRSFQDMYDFDYLPADYLAPYIQKRQYFDSLGGMALGKRSVYWYRPGRFDIDVYKKHKRQYFDSLGGMALGKRGGPPFNMFRGNALG